MEILLLSIASLHRAIASDLTKGQSWSFVPHGKVVESDAVTAIIMVTGMDRKRLWRLRKRFFKDITIIWSQLEKLSKTIMVAFNDFNHFMKAYRLSI